ncbi:MAG: ABC transporter permease [Candidatus Acidiferrales bacterium]
MGNFLQDLRFASRMLRKNPGYAVLAAVVLALGIGVNTAIFSVADAFLNKPGNVPDPRGRVMVMERRTGSFSNWNSVAPANFSDWQEQCKSIESWGASMWYTANISSDGATPEQVQGFQVDTGFFSTLAARPHIGRTFVPEEMVVGRDQVVVLGYGLWQRRFGGESSILGRDIKVEGRPQTVIGVMPKEFDFPKTAELWMPLAMTDDDRKSRTRHALHVVGRMKPGVSEEQVRAEMETIAKRLAEAYPDSNRGWGVRVLNIRDYLIGDLTRSYTQLLLGAVGFVLLIACANVANLQLARSSGRRKEIAVRVALGAKRGRVVRQLLTESVLVSLAGLGLGLLLALWSIELILRGMPHDVARFVAGWHQIQLDWRAVAYAFAVAVGAGIVAGLAPALQTARTDVNEVLKEGSRGATASRARHRLRSALVVAEVAAALVLLVGAGLMVRGVRNLVDDNRAFEPESLLTFMVNLPDQPYGGSARRIAFYDAVLERLKTVPGVQSAGLARSVPYADNGSSTSFSVEGQPAEAGEHRWADYQSVNEEHFKTMPIALLDGRYVNESDAADTQPVVVISKRMAERFWPGRSAIGQRIKLGTEQSDAPWLTVVGVVQDVKTHFFSREANLAVYRPYRQSASQIMQFALRVEGDPLSYAPAIRSLVTSVDADMPIYEVKTHARVIHETLLGLKYVASMLSVIGVMALVLSSAGIYGVMAYAVSERTHEIGVRMALGARAADVLRMVLARGLLLTTCGLAIGGVLSVLLARAIAGLLFGVGATDFATFGLVVGGLAAVALLACWIPATRATRVDPMIALRYE